MSTAGERADMRAVRHELQASHDGPLLRVLSMIDAMPERGAADDLIAPVRARLATLRPSRPLTFSRLLFQPLDPLIVPARDWRRGGLRVPRSVLPPIAAAAEAALGAQASAIRDAIAPLTTADTCRIRRVGSSLWGAAGGLLASVPAPATWTAVTGLPQSDYLPIVTLVGAVLARAFEVERLAASAVPDPGDIDVVLRPAIDSGSRIFAALTLILAERLPSAGAVFAAAAGLAARHAEPQLHAAVEQAIDATLDGLAIDLARVPRLQEKVRALRRVVTRIDDLVGTCVRRPAQRGRLEALRRSIDTASRLEFDTAIEEWLLQPAACRGATADAEAIALEATARELRRFETVARRLGGAEHYDRRLHAAAAALRPRSGATIAERIDRIRLIEILQGSEAAQAALDEAQRLESPR